MPTAVAGPSARQRSSKACETCRARRVRCVGQPPCVQCVEAGLGQSCAVRVKARPRRALSAKLVPHPRAVEDKFVLSSSVKSSTTPSGVTGPISSRRKPLEEIEGAITLWCLDRGLPFAQLLYKPETRLSMLPIPLLPPSPELEAFEDALIGQVLVSQLPDHPVDRPRLLGLYAQYRAMPNSLTEDQTALLHATLCLQRYTQLQLEPTSRGGAREDTTYFQLACAELARWNRPSTFALWALFCLVPWSYQMGGSADTRSLLDQMAWQIRELGLHRRETASLYPPQELVAPLFAAFHYSDTLRASLADLELSLPSTEIDVDPTSPAQMIPDCLRRVSYYSHEYLRDFADPDVDTTSETYITASESRWMPSLREVRHGNNEGIPPVKLAWAVCRYNWLRILLYAPHMAHPRLGAQAHGILVRAASQILHTYAELSATGQLNPSWPQLQRLVVCGQLLVLAHEAGELHHTEATELFKLLLDALDAHVELWPVCIELARGFRKAAVDVFGLSLPPINREFDQGLLAKLAKPTAEAEPPDSVDIINYDTAPWGEFAFDFDPTMLFSMSYNYDSLPDVT